MIENFDYPRGERKEAPSPVPNYSEALVKHLFEPYQTPIDQVASLQGQRVEIRGISNGRFTDQNQGFVTSVNDRSIAVDIDTIHRYYMEDDKIIHLKNARTTTVPAYFISEDPLEIGCIDPDDLNVKFQVMPHLPASVSVMKGYERASFDLKDPYLDKLLDRILRAYPKIETIEDLTRITSYIHSIIPYRPRVYTPGRCSTVGVGKVMEKIGAVCTELSTVELGALELRGLNCSYSLTDTHAYITVESGITNQSEPIFIDPTWNLVGTQIDFSQKVIASGNTLVHHFPADNYHFQPNWDRSYDS